MGLDGVELILRAEKTFGVSLPEQKICRVSTPGQLIDLVCSKLKTTDAETCRNQRAFHLLRRPILRLWKVPREAVRLDSNFRSWLPGPEGAAWIELKREVAARFWPELERPPRLRWSLIALGLGLVALAFLQLGRQGTLTSLLLLLATLCVYPLLAVRLTRRWQNLIPSKYQTVRDLVPLMDATEGIEWNREQVAEKIKRILIEDFGVEEKDYREQAKFSTDLGID